MQKNACRNPTQQKDTLKPIIHAQADVSSVRAEREWKKKMYFSLLCCNSLQVFLASSDWLIYHKFVRVECVLSLSRILLSDVFTVRFMAEMSDAESVVEESKAKDPSANPKPQSSELVDEVFSSFKGYLYTQLEAQGKLIETQSKILRSASEFKFKGNRRQFEFNLN